MWSHPSHYSVYMPTPTWSHKGDSHGHERLIHIPFMSIGPTIPDFHFLKFQTLTLQSKLVTWPWKFNTKVMGVVKGQGHIISPVPNWFASFLFHINWTNSSWDTINCQIKVYACLLYSPISACPSVDRIVSALYLNNTRRIHFIFAHLIKQRQKVCRV